ncbi:hypothetical protein ASPZODRAFT_58333 [Penicilliopsis zonata CBS 506.65]|uniref:Fe2OG dioxygenase domain-containing protein n=1 Tax=Penicilliopsis zonata CBS 506.65 TaxID=1073090 RepID=A0A1L9ST60_9EURO|nr:hypothetical protein ASPZODRAFT_58333 [Penicilliopsis zonata CBS 506.65]OJJ50326.1 hypothetical protein ASPZODRAFT_58333 [Penicilliopsis zonata CBS 506.65]
MDNHENHDHDNLHCLFGLHELPIEPHGLFWQDDFITPEHETQLLSIFRSLDWPDRSGRLALHYGYTFDYTTFGVDPNVPFIPFPEWLIPLIPKVPQHNDKNQTSQASQASQEVGRPPDQVCLQYYPPGSGIPPHVDAHGAWDELYALSLGAPTLMEFRQGERRVEVDLTPRSLMCMSGDSRLHWTHGIKKRKTDPLPDGRVRPRGERWSLTYRWVRRGECECGDLALCDVARRRGGIEKEMRSVK